MKLFKKQENIEIMMAGMKGKPTTKLYRAIREAFYGYGMEIYEKGGFIHFKKGANYEAHFSKSLVEDAIGREIEDGEVSPRPVTAA